LKSNSDKDLHKPSNPRETRATNKRRLGQEKKHRGKKNSSGPYVFLGGLHTRQNFEDRQQNRGGVTKGRARGMWGGLLKITREGLNRGLGPRNIKVGREKTGLQEPEKKSTSQVAGWMVIGVRELVGFIGQPCTAKEEWNHPKEPQRKRGEGNRPRGR